MSVRWQWAPGEQGDSTNGSAEDLPLRRAMAANPRLRVLAACGWYDLVCDPAVNTWIRDHLPAELKKRVTVAAFRGGHALYLDATARAALAIAAGSFFRPADGGSPPAVAPNHSMLQGHGVRGRP
jgi:carboxypeptidase C (cathepsin A)